MIITQDKSKKVIQSHDFEQVNCTIDAEDMRYVASLLRNNYSNPPLAVVREITANALDANLESNSSRSIEVTIPSALNPHFVVRDFGGGLSKEDIFGLYSKYGKSTKRDSNNYIGAFGIGKFAPLSYGDNFTCVSYHNGTKATYNIFVNDDDDTKIVELQKPQPSDEPSGLVIEVAVADEDVDTFRDVCKQFFRFFSEEEKPKFIGVGEDEEFFEPYKVVMEAEDKSWWILEDTRDYWSKSHRESHAVMGRVHYPLDTNAINFSSITDGDESLTRNLKELASHENLYIRFDIGQLKLHHSRESLEYNKQTQKEILSVLMNVQKDIEKIAKKKLGDAEDLWDAKAKYAQVINALPYGLKNLFQNSFEWDGIKIKGIEISRNYKYQDDITITDYYKQDEEDATDGYRVRSSKVHRILPHENTQLCIQFNKHPHGNAQRVRTLFQQNENLDKVTCVYATEVGEEHLYDIDGMQFNKLKKGRTIDISTIEKAKLQSRGKGVSGESRADVPLFEFDVDGKNKWKRKNTDYWLNCVEKIDELESIASEDGDMLIYVPISNYKIVNEKETGQEAIMGLDSFERDVKAIFNIQKEQDDSVSQPLILGVRKKDCNKLNKAHWQSWDDYKKSFAKSYLVDHKDVITKSEKAMAYKENQYNMQNYRLLHALLDNPNWRKCVQANLPSDHIWFELMEDVELMIVEGVEEQKLTTIYRLVSFLKREDEEWVKENIQSDYDVNEFDNKCLEISKQYPLLVNISEGIYGWRSMEEGSIGDNMISYINLCDKVGVGN